MKTQWSQNSSNNHPQLNYQILRRMDMVLQRVQHHSLQKIKIEGRKDCNLRAIQRFTRWCGTAWDAELFIYYTPHVGGSITYIQTITYLQNVTETIG